MHKITKTLLICSASVAMLSGCATVESVKLAQSTADQALTLAQANKVAVQQAQGTADQGVAAAQQAQATADQGVAASKVADEKAQSAGDLAAKNEKVFSQHHETHHRHRKPR